ncbi:hypothetical protein F5B21DRAFT_359939 [Xylaria acuta]|nr:hypothetical protein F5B21DRAFT_359939 [Xylaria acuta]
MFSTYICATRTMQVDAGDFRLVAWQLFTGGPPEACARRCNVYHKGASRKERCKTGLHSCASAMMARRLGCPSGAPLDQTIINQKNIHSRCCNTAEGLACNNNRSGWLHQGLTRLNARRSKSHYPVRRLPPAGDHPTRFSRRRIPVHHLQVYAYMYASPSVDCILSRNDTCCCHWRWGLCPPTANEGAKQHASWQLYGRRWCWGIGSDRLTRNYPEAMCTPFPAFSFSVLLRTPMARSGYQSGITARMIVSFDTDP